MATSYPDSHAAASDTSRVARMARREKLLDVLLPVSTVAGVVVLWALAVQVFSIPEYLLPSPIDIVRRLIEDWSIFLDNGLFTLMSVLLGFLASVTCGALIALAVVLNRTVERILMPLIVMSQTIPKVAIAPVLIVWLGFGIFPKIAVAFLIAFFPIVIATVSGLKSVEPDMLDLVRSMGANTAKTLLKVRIPYALPQFFSGLKIAICLSVVGAIVGEFVGSDRGLGFILLTSTGTLDGTYMWGSLFILIGMGITLFFIVVRIEKLVIPWHVSLRLDEANLYQS